MWETTICEVCRLLDHDQSPKKCKWCYVCKTWICEEDLTRLDRRALAMYRLRQERNKNNA